MPRSFVLSCIRGCLAGSLLLTAGGRAWGQMASPDQPFPTMLPPPGDPPDEDPAAGLVPVEVRQGQRQPTEREQMIMQLAQIISQQSRNDPETIAQRAQATEQYKGKAADAAASFIDREKNLPAGASPETRAELERLRGLALNEVGIVAAAVAPPPTTAPTTQSLKDERLTRAAGIPAFVDKVRALDEELAYRGRRLDVLQRIDQLRQDLGTPVTSATPATRPTTAPANLQAQLDANRDLLRAHDAIYDAESRLAKLAAEAEPAAEATTRPAGK